MINIIKHLNILCFLLCSGSVICNIIYAQYSLLFFLLTSIILFIKKKSIKLKDIGYNKKIIICISSVIIINHLFINNDLLNNYYITCVLYIIGSFLSISSHSFEEFRWTLLKYFKILLLASIFIHLLRNIGILNASYYNINNTNYGLIFRIFNTEWGENRLASIYWEPGQLQVIIWFVLGLFMDIFTDSTKIKESIKIIIIPIIAIIMTNSTTGYITAIFFIASVVMNYKLSKKYIWIWPTMIIIGIIASIAIWSSPIVQEKLNDKGTATKESSYSIRLADNLALMRITKESPISGEGINTKEFRKKSNSYGNLTSSNAWLFASATNGIPFLIFLVLAFYKGIKNLFPKLNIAIIFIFLFISQCNEYAYFYPYFYMYVFRFSRLEKKNIKLAIRNRISIYSKKNTKLL